MIEYRADKRLYYVGGAGLSVAQAIKPGAGGTPTSPGTTNLVSWWTLDETSGTRNDSHGTNHLTLAGTNAYQTGKIGNAYDSTTAGRYIYTNDNASLSLGDIDFTIFGWFYLETIGADRRLITKWDYGNNNREYALVYSHTATRFRLSLSSDGTSGTITNLDANNLGAPSAGAWYFIVAWYDATGNTAYIQVNNGTADSTAQTGGAYDGTTRFVIGAVMFNNGTADGVANDTWYDEVALYKRVLTADEREWLYNSGNGRTYTDL